MKVLLDGKEKKEGVDYTYDPDYSQITFLKPFSTNKKKWWQFWKKEKKTIEIIYKKTRIKIPSKRLKKKLTIDCTTFLIKKKYHEVSYYGNASFVYNGLRDYLFY